MGFVRRELVCGILFLAFTLRESTQTMSTAEIDDAFAAAHHRVQNYEALENAAVHMGHVLKGPSDSAQHQFGTQGRAPTSYKYEALLFGAATLYLVDNELVSNSDPTGLRSTAFASNSQAKAAQTKCFKTIRTSAECKPVNRYTFDGSCNNLRKPSFGRSNICHERLLPPAYEDGVDHPRTKSITGGKLPNERTISLRALNYILPRVKDDPQFNHNRMSFGQFIAHDVSLTPTTTLGPEKALPDCCNSQAQVRDCDPIRIPFNDEVYGNRFCINFVRSQPCPTCQLGPREQMNAVTSFVDLSHIYGITDSENQNLRTGSNGFLRGQGPDSSKLPLFMPPLTQTDGDGCSLPGRPCFLGGDPLRVNQQIGISAWSTLWFRYHNYLAERINNYAQWSGERWSDERIFQTARRIAQAHFQLQVYREWLPTVVGSNLVSFFDLGISHSQTMYDSSVEPSVWTEFAGAAFRFGHSMIQDVFTNRDYMNDVHQPDLDVATRDIFSCVPNYYNTESGFIAENFIAGMYRQKAKQISFSFAPSITHDVYRNATAAFGIDLPALNIHRGRDHGLQPYYKYAEFYLRQAYGKRIKIEKFKDLKGYWKNDCLTQLKQVYSDVRDVDLYVGGLCEVPPVSGSVGPTMGTIIASQFRKIRYGDRLFVSHKSAFSPAQYSELLRTGWLHWVVCASGFNQPFAYRSAFQHNDFSFVNCDALLDQGIDISLFADIARDV